MVEAALIQKNGDTVQNPSDGDVSSALQNLSVVDKNSSLIIYHENMDDFLKIRGDLYNGFSAEYKSKDTENTEISIDKNISFDVILRVAQKYTKQENDWKDLIAWQVTKKKTNILSKIKITPEITVIIFLLLILAGFVFFSSFNNPFLK